MNYNRKSPELFLQSKNSISWEILSKSVQFCTKFIVSILEEVVWLRLSQWLVIISFGIQRGQSHNNNLEECNASSA
jgi:hypothetical protein